MQNFQNFSKVSKKISSLNSAPGRGVFVPKCSMFYNTWLHFHSTRFHHLLATFFHTEQMQHVLSPLLIRYFFAFFSADKQIMPSLLVANTVLPWSELAVMFGCITRISLSAQVVHLAHQSCCYANL